MDGGGDQRKWLSDRKLLHRSKPHRRQTLSPTPLRALLPRAPPPHRARVHIEWEIVKAEALLRSTSQRAWAGASVVIGPDYA